MRDVVRGLARQFSSPRVWVEQLVWAAVLTVIVRAFAWIFNVSLDPAREVAFWLAVPLVAALGFSVLRTFAGYPDLRGAIEQVSVGTADDGSELVSVWIAIRNLGSQPSAATHWRIHVQVGESSVVSDIVPVQFAGAGVVIHDKRGGAWAIPHSEFMHNKGSHGIMGRAYVAGVLVGRVPDGVNPLDILRAGTKLSVTFQDIHGAKLRAEHVMTGVTGDQKWIPGINAAIGPANQLAPGASRSQRRRARRGKN